MAGIFPPASVGGVPPGPNVDNGLDPANPVTGEGPLYVSNTCTTALTSAQLNAFSSEILAAVDRLGVAFNANTITNLGDALVAVLLTPLADKVDRAGDVMAGKLVLAADPDDPLDAASKQYVDSHAAADRVLRAGDTMTGALVLAGNPGAALDAAPKQYVDAATGPLASDKVNRAGDTMTGALGLSGNPVAGNDATTKTYVDAKLAKAGGAMTGPLTLAGDPAGALEACTKSYADTVATAVVTDKISRAGDVMTGALGLSGDPVGANDAARKSYVDQKVANAGLYRGPWQVTANLPDLDPAVMNPLANWTWTAVTSDPAIPENAPATIPGIAGIAIGHGDTIRWDQPGGVYKLIPTMRAELAALRAEIDALKAERL